jgi:predicted ABC-type ATPase
VPGESDHCLAQILEWFTDLEACIPGARSIVGEFLLGKIPLSDGVKVYELAEAWGAAAQQLSEAYEEAQHAADGILRNWTGDGAAMQFADQWYRYLDALASTTESTASMSEAVQGFGLEIETMKFMAVINLIMLAVTLYMIAATAVATLGISTGGIPGAFAAFKTAMSTAASNAIKNIASLSLRTLLKDITAFLTKTLPHLVRTQIPNVIRTELPNLIKTQLPNIIKQGARNLLPKNVIARTVADKMAGQWLKSMLGKGLLKEVENVAGREARILLGRSLLSMRNQLAKEIEEQLLKKFSTKVGTELAERAAANSLTRLAGTELFEQLSKSTVSQYAGRQIAETTFGRELAKYLGTRMAFGAGLMGGGDFLAQGYEMLGGERTSFDWGEVGQRGLEGAAFGAGMWGGPLGHIFGGGLTGGLVTGATGLAQGNFSLWNTVHGAVQGAEAGALFGAQNQLQSMRVNVKMPIGTDVHALPTERGGMTVRAFDRSTGLGTMLTDNKGIAWQRPVEGGFEFGANDRFLTDPGIRDLANTLRGIDVDAANFHDQSGPTTVPAEPGFTGTGGGPREPVAHLPAVESPPHETVPAASPGGGDGGGGGGPRQPASPTSPRVPEQVRVTESSAGPRTIERTPLPAETQPKSPVPHPTEPAHIETPSHTETPSRGATGDSPPSAVPPERPPTEPAKVPPSTEHGPVSTEHGPVSTEHGPPASGEHGPPVTSEHGSHHLAGAGAERGVDPTPRSIEQGTVRMEEHPSFPHVVEELSDLGYSLVHTEGDPHVVVRHVMDRAGNILEIQHEVHVQRGMRFLDLEHELAHVHQMTERFPEGPPPTHIDGKPKIVPPKMKGWQDAVLEYHVRLEEYIRLAERAVDPEILAKHAESVDEWRAAYRKHVDTGRPFEEAERGWARSHFPEIPQLERTVHDLRAGLGPERVPESFGGRTPGGDGLLQKSAGGHQDGVATEHGEGQDAFSGGSIRPRDEVQAWDWAEEAYDRFRGGNADVGEIANNLSTVERPSGKIGFTPKEIGQIKQHLMVEPHLLDNYEEGFVSRRFDADPSIAEAWIRLREGRHVDVDLMLLEHELTESNYLRAHPDATYREAHDYANSSYNWGKVRPERTGEDLETSWGQEHSNGDTAGFQEGPGRQTGGRIHLRTSGDGPQPGDSEGVAGGSAAGREEGPGLRGGVREDSALLSGPSEVAGEGLLRGVEPRVPAEEGERVPYELVPVEPAVVGRVAELPEAVATLMEHELAGLIEGKPPGPVDHPYRADWHRDTKTMTVHYPDGLSVEVALQVNTSLPAGHPVVVRPPVVHGEGGWAQGEPAGVVLPAHAPGEAAARAALVHQELAKAWRTLHGQLAPFHDQSQPFQPFRPEPEVAPPHETPRQEVQPLASLEESGGPEVRVVGPDEVTFRTVAVTAPPEAHPMTPERVNALLHDHTQPEQVVQWAQEHLAVRGEDGSFVPKSQAEIDATLAGLHDEANQAVATRQAHELIPGGEEAARGLHDATPIDPNPPQNQPAPWPTDPVSGYVIQPRDLDFIGVTHEQVEAWMQREAPLGMTVPEYREWRVSLLEALQRDGISPDQVDIRLRGSTADFFSGVHKKLPTAEDLAGNPEALRRLQDWLGEDPNRPTSRPFDSMHKLGLDEPSDYDINISSSKMFKEAESKWNSVEYKGELSKDHGYLNKDLVKRTFPHLETWSREWTDRTGREMSYAVFDGSGPKDMSHLGFYVHFRESDWIVHRPGEHLPETPGAEPPIAPVTPELTPESSRPVTPEATEPVAPEATEPVTPQAIELVPYEPALEPANTWGITEFPRTLPDGHPLLTPTETINTPERLEFRRQLIEDVLGDAQAPATGKPVLYLMGGGGASGKGVVLGNLIENGAVPRTDVVHLDPDALKKKIPEYDEILHVGDSRAAPVVHEESSALAKTILSEAMDRRVNIIYDVTLGDPRKAIDLINRAHQAGYEVQLFGVSAEAETAVMRNSMRAAETGRYVPIEMQLKAHQGFSRGFSAYVDLADRVELYDTNGKDAVLIAAKRPGGQLRVFEPEASAAFEHKAELDPRALGPRDLYRATAQVEPPQTPLTGEAYVEKAMANLALTSRTAGGTIDTSASADKAAQMAADLSGARAAELAQANYRSLVNQLYESRDAQFSSPAELRGFVEEVVRRVNSGITREEVLYREHDSTKYPSYTAVKDLPAAAERFFTELYTRLNDPTADAVETAAWVEYRMDLTDHLWADGCGKSSKAVATWVLMRSGHDLPTYPAERAAQFAHAPKLPSAAGAGVDKVQYREWLDYYLSLFGDGRD